MFSQTVWLPKGLEFLAGLPEVERKRAQLMPMQIYTDESGGTEEQGRFFVMAGVISSAAQWAVFSDDWQACLGSDPAIEYFKMKEAAALRKQFRGFTEKQRDNKLIDLARIINRHVNDVIHISIEVSAHSKLFADWGAKKIMDKIYYWPFHNIIMASALHLWEEGAREPFHAFFDEEVMHGPKTRDFYPVTRLALETDHPKLKAILPTDVVFENDKRFRPLQAADLFAWCLRAGGTYFSEQPFGWLAEEMPNVYLSRRCTVMDEKKLTKILADTQKIFESGEIPYEIFREHAHLFDPEPRR